MEKNRRVGKAYARVPIITIDGSSELSFDGSRLALNGFENPYRDAKIDECRRKIGKGVKIKMDNYGNILIKRISEAPIFVKSLKVVSRNRGNGSERNNVTRSRQQLIENQRNRMFSKTRSDISSSTSALTSALINTGANTDNKPEDIMNENHYNAICDQVLEINGKLELDRINVLFDINKFQDNMSREFRKQKPNRRLLEQQCFSIVGLTKNAKNNLDLPVWVIIINVVAIEMLKEQLASFKQNNNNKSHIDDITHQIDVHRSIQDIPKQVKRDNLYERNEAKQVNVRRKSSNDNRRHAPIKPSSTPNFVSIFNQDIENGSADHEGREDDYENNNDDVRDDALEYDDNNTNNYNSKSEPKTRVSRRNKLANGQDEDPYSLPANSDDKTLSDAYASAILTPETSNLEPSERAPSPPLPPTSSKSSSSSSAAVASSGIRDIRAKFNSKARQYLTPRTSRKLQVSDSKRPMKSYGGSIYSPGHMLILPQHQGGNTTSAVPPKLPPRDFTRRVDTLNNNTNSGNKSDNNNNSGKKLDQEQVYARENDNNLGEPISLAVPLSSGSGDLGKRKSKKSKFLESLRAPFEKAAQQAKHQQQLSQKTTAEVAKNPPTTNAPVAVTSQDGDIYSTEKRKARKNSSIQKLNVFDKNVDNNNDNNGEQIYVPLNEVSKTSSSSLINYNNNKTVAVEESEYNELGIPTPDYELDDIIHQQQTGEPTVTTNLRERVRGRDNSVVRRKSRSTSKQVYDDNNKLQYSLDQPQPNLAARYSSHDDLRNNRAIADTKYHQRPHRQRKRDLSLHCLTNNNKSLDSQHNNYEMLASSSSSAMAATNKTGLRYRKNRSTSVQHFMNYDINNIRTPNRRYLDDDDDYNYNYSYGYDCDEDQQSDIYDHTNKYSYKNNCDRLLCRNNNNQRNNTVNPYDTSTRQQNYIASRNSKSSSYATPSQIGGGQSHKLGLTCNYDLGRSSSGIYGNNSSSSSSDYVYWQPALRKGSSSGYLNSVFRTKLSDHTETSIPPHQNNTTKVFGDYLNCCSRDKFAAMNSPKRSTTGKKLDLYSSNHKQGIKGDNGKCDHYNMYTPTLLSSNNNKNGIKTRKSNSDMKSINNNNSNSTKVNSSLLVTSNNYVHLNKTQYASSSGKLTTYNQ